MAERVRAFLALELPSEAVRTAGEITERLRADLGDGDVKWVAPKNLHVTLRFFGDLERDQVQRAAELVGTWAARFQAVPSGWDALGAFPSPRRPQVLWLGLADPARRLEDLAQDVNRDLEAVGFGPADKPFRAHVTVGRLRRGRRIAWPASDDLTIPQAPFSIAAIALIRSRLTPRGPVYTPIETAHLQE